MTHTVLMAGSVPLAEPCNGADKNFAALLVRRDLDNRFIVHTSLTEPWPSPSRVKVVASPRAGDMPTRAQKLRGLAYLLGHGPSADLVHVVASLYAPFRWAGPALRLWSNLWRTPIVHTIPSTGEKPLARRNMIGDATVVFSEHTRRRLEDLGIPGVFRVHPPLEIEHLRPKNIAAPERLGRALRLGRRAVLYPAHFGEDSGIRQVIRAFGHLRRSGLKDAVLVLACRAHPWQDERAERRKVLSQAAEAGISDHVRLLGDAKDMPALIRACAATVLVPRKMAGKMDLPLAILESLALGRPVVVSDHPP